LHHHDASAGRKLLVQPEADYALNSTDAAVNATNTTNEVLPTLLLKWEWPELVGSNYTTALRTILHEAPDVASVVRLPPGHVITTDYRPDRVVVSVDAADIVRGAPRRG
jgi:hypothetical protein